MLRYPFFLLLVTVYKSRDGTYHWESITDEYITDIIDYDLVSAHSWQIYLKNQVKGMINLLMDDAIMENNFRQGS